MIGDQNTLSFNIFYLFNNTTARCYQLHNSADVARGRKNRDIHHWLLDLLDLAKRGHIRWIIDFYKLAPRFGDMIFYAWSSCQNIQIVLALQPFLHDLHVQQAEKSTTEAKTSRLLSFPLINKRG